MSNQDQSCSKKNKEKKNKIINKEFTPRNSLLTDLLKITHIQTIYNIFIAMFIFLFLNMAILDYIEKGQINFGLGTVKYSFGKFLDAFQIWIFMKISTCILYMGFVFWSRMHLYFSKKLHSTIIVDYGFLLTFIVNQVLFIVLPVNFLVKNNLPPASSLMLLMEQVRMLMKTHAFVRSNVPRVLRQKKLLGKNATKTKAHPEFSRFLYFMFAPTLIYRDEYPRTQSIRWAKVLWSLTEVAIVIFYTALIFERFIIPPFEKFGLQIFQPHIAILTLFSITLPALCIFLFGFFCILHSWQNAMAELLRFADKLFYKNWWNCTSYNEYYRWWNVIVQDWLYHYIYRDVYDHFRSRLASTLAVFFVSAIFHEYIIAFSLRFFYPVMMFLFGGLGLLMVFVTTNHSKVIGNIFMWFSLFTGNGILFTLYSLEYYARLHCPPHNDKLLDIFLPRSWICQEIENNNTSF